MDLGVEPLEALKAASKAVQEARQAVTQAWARVLGLDPVERAAIEARIAAAHATRQAPALSPARQQAQAPRAAPALRQAHQVQPDQDDDQVQGPAPGV